MTQEAITTIAQVWNTQAPHATALEVVQRFQWSVIPLNLKKEPLVKWKQYQTEETDEKTIQAWIKDLQPQIWGFVTGERIKRVTLDFDGEPGRQLLNDLQIDPHRRTPSGGHHADFKYPGWHVQTLNSKSSKERPWAKRFPGLDIRADGGLAGFCGGNGKGKYTWLRDPDPYELDILPDELRSLLGLLEQPQLPTTHTSLRLILPQDKRVSPDILLDRALDLVRGKNGRDNACFWLTCQLRDNGFTRSEATSIAGRFAQRCPPYNTKGEHEIFSEQDAVKRVESAYSAPARQPWESTLTPRDSIQRPIHISSNDHNGNPIPVSEVAPDGAELHELVSDAIEKQDVKAIYELAEKIAFLPTKDHALITMNIKSKMARCITFSWTAFKRLMDESVRTRKAEEIKDCAPYETTDTGMIYNTESGKPVWISNFTAKILADVITDDGAERTRSYELQAEIFDRFTHFEVPAKEFAKCEWVDEHLGAKARITTGQSMKSHLINAVKYCSASVEHFQYAHTGWREIEGKLAYLHAGGAVCQVSQVATDQNKDLTKSLFLSESASQAERQREKKRFSQVSQVSQENMQSCVRLTGTLTNYAFPSERGDVESAIRASLEVLNLADDIITVPLYCGMWRAPLGDVDFGIHLAGQTGWGKTELVALIQQHFGAAMNAHKLPGSWESTENSLEMLLFQAKDTIVVIDDFKPKGGKVDQDRLHAKADRLFRQLGNGSARGRLTSNLEQRVERRPRCLMISTGEDIPRGQSLRARGVVLTMNERITAGEAARKLSEAQRHARSGLYAQAMAGYIEWLAPRIETIQSQLPELIVTEREELSIDGHARSSTNMGHMLLGMKCFLQFAYERGALTHQEARAYLARCKTALTQIASEACQENIQDRPSEQWRRLLIAALASKSAHLVTRSGEYPGSEYGWVKSLREVAYDGFKGEEDSFRGGGSQIGWIDGDDIYLLPAAAYKAAKAIGSATGDDITTLEPTLRKFLFQDGVLASTDLDKARKTITVRRSLEKLQQDVLHVKKKYFYPECPPVNSPDLHDSPDLEASETAGDADLESSQVLDLKVPKSSQVPDYAPGEKHNAGNTPQTTQDYRPLAITPETSTNYPYDVYAALKGTGHKLKRSHCTRNHRDVLYLPWFNKDDEWVEVCSQCYGKGLRATRGRECYAG